MGEETPNTQSTEHPWNEAEYRRESRERRREDRRADVKDLELDDPLHGLISGEWKLPKRNAGRPARSIDLDIVENLAALGLTYTDVAYAFSLSLRQFERRKTASPSIEYAMQRGKALGRISLARQQWRTAFGSTKSAATMQIWLGRQYLGQKQVIEAPQIQEKDDPYSVDEITVMLDNLLASRAESIRAASANSPDDAPAAAGTLVSVGGLGEAGPTLTAGHQERQTE